MRTDRHQPRLESRSLDQLIAADHRARTLWHASERLELSALRAATIETIHGDLKGHRGLTRFRVRGLQRVRSCLVLYVLAYDLLRATPSHLRCLPESA